MIACVVVALFSLFSSLVNAIQNGAFLHRSTSFSYSMNDPIAQTLLTLDTDRNGRIDPNEISAYARSQGMDAAAATSDFASIDTNGDGVLDSEELQRALGTAATNTMVVEPVSPALAPAHARQEELPVMPAYSDPIVSDLDKDTFTSNKTPSPNFVSAMNAYARNEAVTPQSPSNNFFPANSQIGAPSVGQQIRSVNSAVPPLVLEMDAKPTSASLGSATNQGSNDNILPNDSRQSAMMAAQRVSEQLLLEESEERQARDLDRQAAEIRSNSIALAKQSMQDALDAGAKAAYDNAEALLAKINQLEDQAVRADVKAAALNAKSKMELEEAKSFMAIANKAMQINPQQYL